MKLLGGFIVVILVMFVPAFPGYAKGAKHSVDVPELRFESQDGGTQVYMGKDLLVEFRENRRLRFRATAANELWVGSERKPMDLCWAYANKAINDYEFRGIQKEMTEDGFEIKIEAYKPSIDGKVNIGLKAVWNSKVIGFEYFLSGQLQCQEKNYYAKTSGRHLEATDWHIQNISLPDRIMDGKPDAPEFYNYFIMTRDKVNWTKAPKSHVCFAARKGEYIVGTLGDFTDNGIMGWVDNERGGWLVNHESKDPNQKHQYGLCWMFHDVHFYLPDALPKKGSGIPVNANYTLHFVPIDAASCREISQKAKEIDWRNRKEYQLPVLGRKNDFRQLISCKDGEYMWSASSYECWRDDKVGYDDHYSVTIKKEKDDGPEAWYSFNLKPDFVRDPVKGSYKMRAMVKTQDVEGWAGISVCKKEGDGWVYSKLGNQFWPKDPNAVEWIRSKPLKGTNDWTPVEIEVIAEKGKPLPLLLVLEQHGKGQSWFDNVVIEELK